MFLKCNLDSIYTDVYRGVMVGSFCLLTTVWLSLNFDSSAACKVSRHIK